MTQEMFLAVLLAIAGLCCPVIVVGLLHGAYGAFGGVLVPQMPVPERDALLRDSGEAGGQSS